MNKFIRYFNQNRREIIVIVIIILFMVFLLKLINWNIKIKHEEQAKDKLFNNTQNNTSYNKNINTYQVITGTNDKNSATDKIEYITNFIKFCNEKDIENAYSMISEDCKEVLFPTIDYFKKAYYNNNFKTNKIYEIQAWNSSTYKVDLMENMLQTGKINSNSIQDFITVIKVQNEYKLNINNFIGKTTLNKTNIKDNISIEAISKDTFMTHEIYTINVKNDNSFAIYLDELNQTNTIYLTDENDINHVAYLHELTKEQLRINPHSNKEIRIKFSNGYIVDREFTQMTFSNIKLENEEQNAIKIELKLQ